MPPMPDSYEPMSREREDHFDDDRRRFTELFEQHYAKIAMFAHRRITSDEADDIVAQTFLTAWRHLESLPEDPLPWLYRAARNAIANARRGALRRQRLIHRVLHNVGSEVDAAASDGAVWSAGFSFAFASLSERDQEVLILSVVEGLSPAEGAVVIGCSPEAFKVRSHRARKRLRRRIEADRSLTEPVDDCSSFVLPITRAVATAPAATTMVDLPLPLKEYR
jgi:RNA polymerase sigma factor (sigma-70 family)